MLVKRKILTFRSTSKTDVFDLTSDIREFVRESDMSEGQVLVFVPGSTASVTTIEYETGVVEDLIHAVERLIPSDISYRHNLRWGDGNGYSHVRAAFLKPSLSVPVWNGEIVLGTWQQIVLIDFDNKPRKRSVVLHMMGV